MKKTVVRKSEVEMGRYGSEKKTKWFLKIMRMITPYHRLSGQIRMKGIVISSHGLIKPYCDVG